MQLGRSEFLVACYYYAMFTNGKRYYMQLRLQWPDLANKQRARPRDIQLRLAINIPLRYSEIN